MIAAPALPGIDIAGVKIKINRATNSQDLGGNGEEQTEQQTGITHGRVIAKD